VHIALELDHDPFLETAEVHNEPVPQVLSPKLEAQNPPVAQQRPRMTLGRRGPMTQLLGERESLRGSQPTKRIHCARM
jgi:hypothetical protein